jgi:hypothetical protein
MRAIEMGDPDPTVAVAADRAAGVPGGGILEHRGVGERERQGAGRHGDGAGW